MFNLRCFDGIRLPPSSTRCTSKSTVGRFLMKLDLMSPANLWRERGVGCLWVWCLDGMIDFYTH